MIKLTAKQQRDKMKFILSRLSDSNRTVFNRMYAPKNNTQDVNITVDELPERRLDWALTQCKNTYHQIFTILKDQA